MLRTPLLPAGLLLALATGACTPGRAGYQRASATADQTDSYRENLVRLREHVGLTLAALRTLSENPSDSPRSNRETFQTYERELANLSDQALRSRRSYGRMDARAELFFGGWVEDTATIQDADLKKASSTRRTALQASYTRLAQGQLEVDQGLERFLDTLRDLDTYLEHDLTSAGIQSAQGTIATAVRDGSALQDQISQLAHATDDARAGLTPLQAQAPAAVATEGQQGRVR